MTNSLVISLRILFGFLGTLMVLTLAYTLSIDGLPFRKDLLTPWMAATVVDFYINIVPLAVWISYKESSDWICATIWVILLVCLGRKTCRKSGWSNQERHESLWASHSNATIKS